MPFVMQPLTLEANPSYFHFGIHFVESTDLFVCMYVTVSCFWKEFITVYYPRRARSALGVDTVLTLDVCLYVCMLVL